MDKKSNRTDLLAAGRKKLQQFRQKKDNKGKEGKGQKNKSASTADIVEQHDEDKAVSTSIDANDSASEPSQTDETSALGPFQVAEASPSEPSLAAEALATEPSQVTEISDLSHMAVASTSEPSQVSNVETELLSNSNPVVSVPIEDSPNVAFEEGAVRIPPVAISDNVEKDGAASEPVDLLIGDSSAIEIHLYEKNSSHASNEMDKPGDCEVEEEGDVIPQVLTTKATVTESNEMAFDLIDADAGQKGDQVSDVGELQEAKNAHAKHGDGSKGIRPKEDDSVSLPILNVAVKSHVFSGSNQENLIADDSSDLSTKLDEPASQTSMVEEEYGTTVRPVAAASHSDHHDGQSHHHRDDKIAFSSTEEIYRDYADVNDHRSSEGYGQKNLSGGSECNLPLSSVDGRFLSLMELADIIKGLSHDDYMFLVKSRGDWEIDFGVPHKQLSGEISALNASLVDAQQRNKNIEAELLQSRSELEAAIHRNEDLQNQFSSAKTEVLELSARIDEILEESTIRNSELTSELDDCQHSLANLQAENELLTNSLRSAIEEKRELINVNEQYFDEIQNLSFELAYHRSSVTALLVEMTSLNVSLAFVIDEHMKLEGQKESISAENDKLKLDLANCEHVSNTLKNAAAEDSYDFPKILMTEAIPVPGSPKVESSAMELHEDFPVFLTLKERLQMAEKIAEEIEMAVEEMQSHTASLSGRDSLAATSGVSKLIQTFESKTHDEEHMSETSMSIGDQIIDPYLSGKSRTRSLRAVLNMISQDIEHACHLFQVKRKGQKVASEEIRELEDEGGASSDYIVAVESRNIELEVMYTVIKQYICSTNAMKAEHAVALQREETGNEAQDKLQCQRMLEWSSRVNKFHALIPDMRRILGEMGFYMVSELEELRKDVSLYLHQTEEAKQSSHIMVAQMLEKLGATMGPSVTLPSLENSADNADIFGCVYVSIISACQMIENMKERLEACSKENDVMSNKFEEAGNKFEILSKENMAAASLLRNVFEDLVRCLKNYGGNLEEIEAKNFLDTLDATYFDHILKHLACLLGERTQLIESNVLLKESNDKLQVELLEKVPSTEQRDTEGIGEDVVMIMLDDVRNVLNLQHEELNLAEHPLIRLQYLISFFMEKYKEADEKMGMLKNDINSRTTEVNELRGTMEMLSLSNFEQQNQILVLSESLIHGKQAFDELSGELRVKVSELGHSENRVASVREKLSIAVAKGKGLIAQRDSLKQEVQLKEAKILEVEERLKVYAEAGERMEALESELSYIRNSATALRESFLLKDSALQRIEEILEDIDLPEHFHSQDIMQKVDYLAKTVVAGNSSPPPNWSQKFSGGDGSSSDINYNVVDGNAQSDSNPLDDLKMKFEELQIRFYELAEQNEMLEQSLMERNNLLQKWEEVLDRIDVPPQLRSMEPEDRILWLGTALSEADDHITTLQKKIESLEHYSESVTADMQDSERRFSEIDSSLQATSMEKEKLYGEIESLTSEHEKLLKEVIQFKQKADDLQRGTDALQNNLLKKLHIEENIQQIEGAISRMQDLIIEALPLRDSKNQILDVSSSEILETLIRELLEDYERLHLEISVFKEAITEHLTELAATLAGCNARDHFDVKMAESSDASLYEPRSRDLVEELNTGALTKQLDGTLDALACLTVERDGYLETIRSMANELKEFDQEKKELRKLLNQEEDKSASLRDKLNVAVRKGKSLVQHRDSLKQMIEEMTSEIDQLKTERTTLKESVASVDQKIKEMSSELENSSAVKSENVFLKNQWEELKLYLHSLVMDGWNDNTQPGSNPLNELKMIFEELRQRSDELAEKNGILEQYLMERSKLLQQWKEALDRINVPPQLQSMEPEDRIQWLGTALSEADDHLSTLQKKIENLENYCKSVTADMQDSERRFSELGSSFQVITLEKDELCGQIEIMTSEHERLLKDVARSEQKSDDLQSEVEALQKQIENLENYSKSVTADMQDSERRFSELDSSLQVITLEKDELCGRIEIMTSEHERLLKDVARSEQKSDDLQKQLLKKLQVEENIQQIEGAISRMQDLVMGALPTGESENQIVDVSSSETILETLIRRLLDEYQRVDIEISVLKEAVTEQVAEAVTNSAGSIERGQLDMKIAAPGDASLNEPRTRDVVEEQDIAGLGTILDRTLDELACTSAERDGYIEMIRSLAGDLVELDLKKKELQKQQNQEEQKSASLREKLNVAVRKGKSLVQHRDSLKQMIEEKTAEIDQLKSERITWKESVSAYDQKIKDMSSQLESWDVVKSENDLLRNQLEEYKRYMQEREGTLSIILQKLGEINVGGQLENIEPVIKLEGLQKHVFDLQAAAGSFEQEVKKSKRAVELLLAEMNEVQERNDGLQEEVANAKEEISHLLRQKDIAESSKLEVISHLNKLCEEQRNQLAFYELFKSKLHETENGFVDLSNVIVDIFANNGELLHSLKMSIESCLKPPDTHLSVSSSSAVVPGIREKEHLISLCSGFETHDRSDNISVRLQQLTTYIKQFEEGIGSYSLSLWEEAKGMIDIVGTLQGEVILLIESLDSMKSAKKGRDNECLVIYQMLSLLYEACASSVIEIEQKKSQLDENHFPSKDVGSRLKVLPLADIGLPLNREVLSSSEENVKNLADRIILAVKEFVGSHAESNESKQEELKTTISNLQKIIREKDVKEDEMCKQLVSKIKEAESAAAVYSRELQSAKTTVLELESRLEIVEKERSSLEKNVIDMQQKQLESVELQEKVSSLSGMLVDKDQEIDSLMQALDEEENQMEGLKKKIEELESIIERKNLHVEQVEAAQGKAMKKLSITVNRFDELHEMSEGLLTEVEYLQTQLQDRDSEISFLRQEVTKCTNDVLLASKMTKERNSNELQELLTWLENLFSPITMPDEDADNHENHHNSEHKDRVKKVISCIIAELEELRVATQSKDTSLQVERNRVEELLRVKEALEVSLNQKESHLNSLLGAGEFRQSSSEIVEVEPVVNKRVSSVTGSQVLSLRKGNNDQVSIAIEADASDSGRLEEEDDDKVHGFKSLTTSRFVPKVTRPVSDMIDGLWWRKGNNDPVSIAIEADASDSGRLEEEDDDKVHGFKSLTTSRFVPKFTRPVSDMIDGLWVSCDRTLMRQPAFRLGIMLYWAVLHALLATFVF